MYEALLFILISWGVVGSLVFLELVYDWHTYRKRDKYWQERSFSHFLRVNAEESFIITICWPVVMLWFLCLIIGVLVDKWS